jgi:hypothetical protein
MEGMLVIEVVDVDVGVAGAMDMPAVESFASWTGEFGGGLRGWLIELKARSRSESPGYGITGANPEGTEGLRWGGVEVDTLRLSGDTHGVGGEYA